VDLVEEWQGIYTAVLGRRLAYASDEYYLLAGRPFPPSQAYEGFAQHENGVGMAAAFASAFQGDDSAAYGVRPGFFAWVDGAPALGYRAGRAEPGPGPPPSLAGATGPTAILTGEYGARVLAPLVAPFGEVRVVTVANEFFGGNIGVAGLLTGADLARALSAEPEGERYLLPDVCLSGGRFLDGLTPADLPRAVEVVPTDGASLRRALEAP
jgi:NifB/MoaA-like Fe-S oxidoreductase